MIIRSYEIKKNLPNFLKYNFYLLYGENFGLKKDIKNIIQKNEKNSDAEFISFYESEIIENEENFYNFIFSGSLFSSKKIITIFDATDKMVKRLTDIYEKNPENIAVIAISSILEKKSKLRIFFEKNNNAACVACYPDSEKDLEIIAQTEFKKDKINLSREAINLLIEKSNSDRQNLKNEIEKIKSYSTNKKTLELNEIKTLINFTGDHKSDALINECLCGNTSQYKKIISEIYINTANQILLLRILANKVQRLSKIKEQESGSYNLENFINNLKPPIFWKEKPVIKKQLTIWNLGELKKIKDKINNTELLCKKNPSASSAIFFSFFLEICKKANSYS